MSKWDGWLRQLAAAGKGPLRLYADRATAFDYSFTLPGDWTAATLRGQIRIEPDAGSSLASFTVGTPELLGDDTLFTIALAQATVEGLPADDDGEGMTELPFDLLLDPAVGNEFRLLGGTILISGAITQ